MLKNSEVAFKIWPEIEKSDIDLEDLTEIPVNLKPNQELCAFGKDQGKIYLINEVYLGNIVIYDELCLKFADGTDRIMAVPENEVRLYKHPKIERILRQSPTRGSLIEPSEKDIENPIFKKR